MKQLGKPLVFYLKYMSEMDRLYADVADVVIKGQEPDITGLEDVVRVREISRGVGSAACEQAADFLELCGKGIMRHFAGLRIAALAQKTKRATIIRRAWWWEWSTQVNVPAVPGGWFRCGVRLVDREYVAMKIPIDSASCGVVVPWLWSQGNNRTTDTVWNILGGWPHSRGGEGPMHSEGSIALACIQIRPEPLNSFEVDREPLVAEAMRTIARIGAKETMAIAEFVASLAC